MKRFGNLYYRICDIDNLYLAYTKARKGKGNTYGVIQFEKELDDNINTLHKELSEGKYFTSEYQTFIIHDPKEREIYRLPFRDRVVHHAIMNILEDIWTPIFISKKGKDKRLLELLDGIIDSAPGIPIGNYLSQFFANLYLSYFDHWLKEERRIKYYYRYADDMVILSSNKEELHSLLGDIKSYLHNKLHLNIPG